MATKKTNKKTTKQSTKTSTKKVVTKKTTKTTEVKAEPVKVETTKNVQKKDNIFTKMSALSVKTVKAIKKSWDDAHKNISYNVGHQTYKALNIIMWSLIVIAMPLTMLLVTLLIPASTPFWLTFYPFMTTIIVIWAIKFFFSRYKKKQEAK